MALNTKTLAKRVTLIDWVACVFFVLATVFLLASGHDFYAAVTALSAVVSGVAAWLKPAERLSRWMEKRMFRKRSSTH